MGAILKTFHPIEDKLTLERFEKAFAVGIFVYSYLFLKHELEDKLLLTDRKMITGIHNGKLNHL